MSDPRLAAFLSSGRPQRFYTGLSTLVCVASEGDACVGLVTFDALELLLSVDVGSELSMQLGGSFSQSGRRVFARSFAALCAQARELEDLRLYACSAAVQTLAIDRARIDERLDGVMSTPGFLKLAGSAQIIFV